MTTKTDIRERVLAFAAAVDAVSGPRLDRAVERFVTWIDDAVAAAHVDGQALAADAAPEGDGLSAAHEAATAGDWAGLQKAVRAALAIAEEST